jgi:anti-anti-sigma factor
MIKKTEHSNTYKVEAESLDILCMGAFENELESILKTSQEDLYLDFSEVRDLSSAILGILLHKKMKMRKLGKEIYLQNASPTVIRILKILNLTSQLLQKRNKARDTNFNSFPYTQALSRF